MEIVLRSQDLLAELSLAMGAVERKVTMPVLGHVKLFTTDEGTVGIMATDLEVAFTSTQEAVIDSPGEALIPGKRLHDYVSLLPNDDVTIKVRNGRAHFTCGRNRTSIPVLTNESLPELPFAGDPQGTIPAAQLALLLERVVFAVSTEESKFTIQGALLSLTEAGVTLSSTDGRRLSTVSYAVNFDIPEEVKAIIPRRAISELLKLSSKAPEGANVDILIEPTHLYFRFGNRLVYCRTLSGKFPDLSRCFLKGERKKALFASSSFCDALGRVSRFADDRSKAVKMTFAEDGVCLMASASETGVGEETVDAEYQGESVEIGINSQYILDVLKLADNQPVVVYFKDGKSQVELRLQDDPTWVNVLMPMSVN